MRDARLKRKECTKCHLIHATRLYDVSVAQLLVRR
jgi:Zn-finger protein